MTIGGVAAAVTNVGSDGLSATVTVPSGVSSGTVTVTAGSSNSSWSGSFQVINPAPSVSGLSASALSPGQSLTISGSAFDAVPTHDDVWIGGAQAAVTAATSTSLTVRVPPGAGSGPVMVTTPSGTSTADPWFFTIPAAVSPTGLCTSVGTMGSAVTPGCGNALIGFTSQQDHVYQLVGGVKRRLQRGQRRPRLVFVL